jgi:glycerophosphoryl diester phosphodiesterase
MQAHKYSLGAAKSLKGIIVRATTGYLSPSKPRIFAHRGLSRGAEGQVLDENTIPAFQAAIEAGATHIETDIQVTKDGIPVLFHDDDLSRVTEDAYGKSKISELTFQQIRSVRLTHGGEIPSLAEALDQLSEARFNLDFKVNEAVRPGCKVLIEQNAVDRVLVSAFSESRRKAVLRQIARPIATSAGGALVIWAYVFSKLGVRWFLVRLLRDVNALQIPVSAGPMRFATQRFIASIRSVGVEIHFWTINDPQEMRNLVALGADGIVTDRTDLAVSALLG